MHASVIIFFCLRPFFFGWLKSWSEVACRYIFVMWICKSLQDQPRLKFSAVYIFKLLSRIWEDDIDDVEAAHTTI